MVKALHRAGLEVILDVVYNHTAEGDHRGPMLAFRGLDNASYYRLEADRRAAVVGNPAAIPAPPAREHLRDRVAVRQRSRERPLERARSRERS